METIIQQIALDLAKKITEKAISGGISDIDALASEVLNECKLSAAAMIETISAELNRKIRADKAGRKAAGLVLKEKNRPRQLHTELGLLNVSRDYYHDKKNNRYIALLDHITAIRAYERVGDGLSAKMVRLATEMSYAKSAAIASGGKLSSQTVKNHIRKLDVLEMQCEDQAPRTVKALHVYADEDHVHMQRADKRRGKKSKIVPLVTVTEGTISQSSRRNRTIGCMHFVDEEFDSKRLWKSVEGYIGKRYRTEEIEAIYLHADGGKWIRNGLDSFAQRVHVMDGYHLGKRLKEISRKYPNRNIRKRIEDAILEKDRRKAEGILQNLYKTAETEKQRKYLSEFEKYLMGNWEAVVNRRTLEIPGSCTEGQVSHVLSERFSRDPAGWSEEGLGKLAKLRVYEKNGGKITADDFKRKREKRYSEYADQMIRETMAGAIDWSLFDKEPFVFDGASGTQITMNRIGHLRNTLWN